MVLFFFIMSSPLTPSLAQSHVLTLKPQQIAFVVGPTRPEVVIRYADMVYQVLQAKANASAKSTHRCYRFMSVQQLYRLSQVLGTR